MNEIKAPGDTGLFGGRADSPPAMVWISGINQKCVWFNRNWLEFTGRTLEQETADGWGVGVHPEDLTRCLKIHLSAFAQQEPFEIEYRLRRHDGEYRLVLDKGDPYFDSSNKFLGFAGDCIEVQEDKRNCVNASALSKKTVPNPISWDFHSPAVWKIDLRKKIAQHKTGLIVYLESVSELENLWTAHRTNAVEWVKQDHAARAPIVALMVRAAVSIFAAEKMKK